MPRPRERFPFGGGRLTLGAKFTIAVRGSWSVRALIDEIIVWLVAGAVSAFALLVAAREQRRAREAIAEARAAEGQLENARQTQAQAEGEAARARAAAKA